MRPLQQRLWTGLAHKPAIQRQLATWLPLILALVAYGLAANLLFQNLDHFTGDEPHYMLIAHSLCYDGDIDLKNNYGRQDYLSFYPRSSIDPHAYDYLGDGKLHPFHNIGLPLLLTLPYCLLGHPYWARIEMAILAALASWTMFLLVRGYARHSALAWSTWAMVTFSSPLWTHAPQIYPDVVAILGTTMALLLLRPPCASSAKAVALSMVVAGLPWLHNRLAFLSLMILATAFVHLLRSGNRRKHIVLLLILPCLGGVLWMWSSYVWYGSPWPNAVYTPWQGHLQEFSWEKWYVAMVDLVLGRELGLLTYAPVYWVALVGLVAMVLRREGSAWVPAVWLTGYVLAVSFSQATYGAGWGYYFPGRLLLPVVPLLAIPLAHALWPARWLRIATVVLFMVSVLISVQSLISPYKALADQNGVSELPFLKHVQKLYPATLFVRDRIDLDASEVHHQVGQLMFDQLTNAQAIVARPEVDEPGSMAAVPSVAFQDGDYIATFSLKLQPPATETLVAHIDVSTYQGERIVAQGDIYGRDFWSGTEYQDFALPFSTQETWALEFRVLFAGQAELWLQGIRVEPRADLPGSASRSWPIVSAWGASVLVAGLWVARSGTTRTQTYHV
jgi:hypothetical protein